MFKRFKKQQSSLDIVENILKQYISATKAKSTIQCWSQDEILVVEGKCLTFLKSNQMDYLRDCYRPLNSQLEDFLLFCDGISNVRDNYIILVISEDDNTFKTYSISKDWRSTKR